MFVRTKMLSVLSKSSCSQVYVVEFHKVAKWLGDMPTTLRAISGIQSTMLAPWAFQTVNYSESAKNNIGCSITL